MATGPNGAPKLKLTFNGGGKDGYANGFSDED